jgi:serine/threonine protein kinase
MDPHIGSSYGPYVVEEVIARGGQGLVLKTRHSQRGVPAALKILFDPSPLARGRFLREIETLRQLADHPGLPSPYDLGEHEGTLFIALEFVEGRSIQDAIHSGGPMPELEALELVAKTARIVAQCHEQGVLHRDLKPANVVIRSESGAPCVVDFGVARVEGKGVSEASRLSMTGDLIGTPAFMAPEQVSGEGVGLHTDVYGLGSILYFALSGQRPVTGTTSLNILTKLARDETPDVRDANPAVSAATAELLLRAMAKEPAERISSAALLAEELDALARGGAEESSPGSKLALGAGVLVGLLLLVGLVLAFSRGLGATTPPASASAAPSPSDLAGSETPRASPGLLLAQEPGTATWTATFEDSALISHSPLGPYALVEVAPVLQGKPRRKLRQAHLLSLVDGKRLVPDLPAADLWCWDAARERALLLLDGELLSVSARSPKPKPLAQGLGELCSLSASGDVIYTARPRLLELRDAKGALQRAVALAGHLEAPPLELDLDPNQPGPDHLLVATTGSQALLLTKKGRRRKQVDLPGPVSTQPVVLRSTPESCVVGLVSGAGILTRLEVRPRSLRLLGSRELGHTRRGRPLEPRGPLLVDRDAEGAARQVFLHLLSGIACFSPDLSELRWRAGHPEGGGRYVMTGLALCDLDRNKDAELLATFVNAGRKAGPRQLTHVLYGPRGRAQRAGPLHLSPRYASTIPGGSLLLTQADDTLVRWGPWSRLPDASAALSKPPRPARPLDEAGPLLLQEGGRVELELEKTTEGPPYLVRFHGTPQFRGGEGIEVTASQGVQSVWLMGEYLGGAKGLVVTQARFDINLVLQSEPPPAGEAWLELDLLITPKFGPAFAEFAFAVDERPVVRTVRAFHRKSRIQVPLGEVNSEGLCATRTYLTTRSRAQVKVKSIRLFFREKKE